MSGPTFPIIQSDRIQAGINPLGAELNSLKDKLSGREYLWQADPKFWNRRAPILFPVVGRLKDNQYLHTGKSYSMGQHGFARDSTFEIVEHLTHSVVLKLINTSGHASVYPFLYDFEVAYSVSGSFLTQEFRCRNRGNETMFFSVGGHPAFHIDPIESGSLTFSPALNHDLFRLEDGCILDQPVDRIQSSEIVLGSDTFLKDALIFAHTKHLCITLCQDHQERLRVYTDELPYLGIWSKPGAPFVCIEPWDGIADFASHNGKLHEKIGIIALTPGEVYRKGFRIEIC